MSKRTFSWIIPAIIIGTLVFIANMANAQEGMMKGKHEKEMMSHKSMKGEKHHGGHKFFLGMYDELGLSDEQISTLRTLKSQTEKQMIRTTADLDILQIELHDLLQEDKVNVKMVDSKIEKIGKLQTKVHKVHIHAKLDAQKVLSEEQLKKVCELKGKGRHEKKMCRERME